nr:protein kinase [Streptomyces sp. NBC_00995]
MDGLRPQDPARIGAYQLLARLGSGGMGQVYLGRSPGGRLVAVKVIRADISDHPDALARFRREAATIGTVRSAYTAQLIEASLDTSPYWLATEYVSGPTLRGAIGAKGPFPPDSALRLLAALAEGLAAVHVHGVTHRDVKPHNVILSPQGPQLIDFGIARGLENTILTREGMTPGTPGFTAPEVLLRNEVGPAADVFALGATLAHAATGRPPYGEGEAAVVNFRTVYEDIDLEGVRPDLAALIHACAAKDPAKRPGLAAVIAGCAVDTPLAVDPHYRAVTQGPAPVAGYEGAAPPLAGAHFEQPARRDPDTARTAETVARSRAEYEGPAARRGGEPHAPEPTPAPGTTAPSGGPERPRAPGRAPRGTTWLAVCAVAIAAPLTVWLLPESGGRSGGTGAGTVTPGPTRSGQPAASGTAGRGPDTRSPAPAPPAHLVNDDRVSRDRWTLSPIADQAALGSGSCDPAEPPEDFPPDGLTSSVSHTTGSDTARVSMRPKDVKEGERPEPYYVSVGVRPPHETDRATGRPLASVSKGVGFTSEPVDLYSRRSSGGTVRLRYPDDFRAHFGDRVVDAIPVGDDRGDWTVVIYHVEGGASEYTSVVCNGFHA